MCYRYSTCIKMYRRNSLIDTVISVHIFANILSEKKLLKTLLWVTTIF